VTQCWRAVATRKSTPAVSGDECSADAEGNRALGATDVNGLTDAVHHHRDDLVITRGQSGLGRDSRWSSQISTRASALRCAAVGGSGMSSASGRGAARCSISPRNAVPCSAPSQPSKLIRHRSDRGCAAHRPRNRDPQGQQALVRRDRAPVSQHGSYEPVPRTAYRVEQFLRAQCGNRLAQCVDAAQRRLHTVVGGRSHASILSLYPDKEGPARPQRKKDDTNGQIHRLTVPAPLVIRRKLADTAARRWRW
jgi:hypothetical protein